MEKTNAFGIFEGGGAKGIAHPGALKAAEQRFQFIGVAGTSAGAIMASLVAAGYTADEVFSPDNANSLFHTNLLELLDREEWIQLDGIRKRFGGEDKSKQYTKKFLWWASESKWFFASIGIFFGLLAVAFLFLEYYGWIAFMWLAIAFSSLVLSLARSQIKDAYRFIQYELMGHFFLFSNLSLFRKIVANRGVLKTEVFRTWINEKIKTKLVQRFPDKRFGPDILFKDLPVPLKIIAAEHQKREIREFSSVLDPDLPIADAVCASISIPFVFTPKKIGGVEFVDGGMMSNFPAWVFDEELKSVSPFTPIIGFRLVGDSEPSPSDEQILMHYTRNVAYCALFGDAKLETRKVGNLIELLLPVKLDMLEFDATKERKEQAYRSAYMEADRLLSDSGNVAPVTGMKRLLGIAKTVIEKNACIPGVHLRLCIMIPVSANSLRVAYSINMDSEQDTDDQLVLDIHQGAAGACWMNEKPVECDLVEAKKSYSQQWEMDKRQQRLIRPTLKSLLCLPMFKPGSDSIIGVFCIDSDDDINHQLRRLVGPNGEDVIAVTQMLANFLVSWGKS
jgi:NTE family protein